MCRKPKTGLVAEVQRQRMSRMRTRFVATFSSICYIIFLIMNFLCLFSGSESSSMWDTPVVSINTTLLGYGLLQTSSTNSTQIRSIQSTTNWNKRVTAQVNASTLRLFSTNAVADIQSAELGIQQWYNLNILSVCEGRYYPSAVVPGAKFDPSSCISKTPMMYFDLTAHLENELQKGNLNATLSDLDWSSQIQAGLDSANRYLEAAFLLYIFSIVLLLSAMIPSATMVFFTSTYAPLSSKICLLSAITFLLALSSATTVTTFAQKSTSVLNSLGNPIGVSASQGQHFSVLNWASVGIIALVSIVWAVEVCLEIGEGRRERMILHQEHYERARVWGKIGALEGEEPMCSCVDPWKVMGHRKGRDDCGDKGMPSKRDVGVESGELYIGNPWVGVEEKVLVQGQ